MKRIFWCCLLLTNALLVKADGNIMFEQANALYHSKNYDSAAKLYTQLVENGYSSDDLYYNMGNAFYKAQKTGWAIWSYRKSMQINCTQNTLDNYNLAKNQIANPLLEQREIFFIRWWHSFYNLCTVNVWAVISLLSFIVFLVLFYLQVIKRKRLPLFLKYSFLSLFIISFLLMFARYYNEVNHYEAVVVEQAAFKQLEAKNKTTIPEGTEVRIVNKNIANDEDMIMVQLSDLRQGLVSKKNIKRL